MRVYNTPGGFDSADGTLYILTDCWNPNSCVDYDWATEDDETLYYTPDASSDQIFFAVVDFRSGTCGSYKFVVDYDYEPSDCRQGGLLPIMGTAEMLAALGFWALFIGLLWVRRRGQRG
jgi:hypothetical protein